MHQWVEHKKVLGIVEYRHSFLMPKGKSAVTQSVLGDFSSPLTPVETSSKQKITKQTQAFNDTTDRTELIDIYTTFHPKAGEQNFFLKCTWNILQDKPHLGSCIKPRKIWENWNCISIFSRHNAEIRNQLQGEKCKKKTTKPHKHTEAKQGAAK